MGTRYRGPAVEIAALNAYIKLMRAAKSVTARIHCEVGNNLTVSQFGALEIIIKPKRREVPVSFAAVS